MQMLAGEGGEDKETLGACLENPAIYRQAAMLGVGCLRDMHEQVENEVKLTHKSVSQIFVIVDTPSFFIWQ